MIKLAENAGYGLDNIENNWKKYNGSTVEYIIDFDSTIVKFQTEVEEVNNETISERISERTSERISERIRTEFGKTAKQVESALEIIAQNPQYSAEEIATEIGKTSRTVESYIQKLKNAGIIERVGPKFGGYWKIIKK